MRASPGGILDVVGEHRSIDAMVVRTLGMIVLISLILLVPIIADQQWSAADDAYVDGPIGTAVIQAPDPSKPLDVNEP